MAKQSWKQQMIQQIANKQVQQVMQQKQADQLQASFAAWQKEQDDIAKLQASFDAWQKENAPAPVQTAPVQPIPVQAVKEQSKQETIPSLADFRTADNLQYRQSKRDIAANKKKKEDYQRQQQEDAMLASRKAMRGDREWDQSINNTLNMLGTDEFKDMAKKGKAKRAIEEKEQKKKAENEAIEKQIASFDKYTDKIPQLTDEQKALEDQILNADRYVENTPSKDRWNERFLTAQEKSDAINKTTQADVDRWLSPDTKLTNKEKGIARAYAANELRKIPKNKANNQPLVQSDEERQHYADMVEIMNKTNPISSAAAGFIEMPFNLGEMVGDAGRSVANQLGGLGAAVTDKLGVTEGATQRHNERVEAANNFADTNEANMRRSLANAQTQYPLANTGGKIAGQITMYAATNPIFDGIAEGAGVTNQLVKFFINQGAQNAQDLALDTAPLVRQLMSDGAMSEQDKREVFNNILLNALGNAGMGAVQEIPGLTKYVGGKIDARNAADEAFRQNVNAGADNLARLANEDLPIFQDADNVVRNAERQAEEAAQNIDDIADQMQRKTSLTEIANTPVDDLSIAHRQVDRDLKGLGKFRTIEDNDAVAALNKEGKIDEVLAKNPSIKRVSTSARKAESIFANEETSLAEQIDRYVRWDMKPNELFDYGLTPEILKEHGIKGRKIMMAQRIFDKISLPDKYPIYKDELHKVGKHGFDKSGAMKLIRALDDPAVIYKANKDGDVGVVVNLSDRHGNPVLVPLTIGKDGTIENVSDIAGSSKIKSAHIRHGLGNYLSKHPEDVYYIKGDAEPLSKGIWNSPLDSTSPTSNIEDAALEVNKNPVNTSGNIDVDVSEPKPYANNQSVNITEEAQEKIISDFEEIYRSLDNMDNAARATGDAKAIEKFQKLQKAVFDYEEKIWKAEDIADAEKAKKAADAARQGFIRQIKKIDPNYKGDLTGTKLGQAIFRRDEVAGIPSKQIDEMVNDWVDQDINNPNRFARDAEPDSTNVYRGVQDVPGAEPLQTFADGSPKNDWKISKARTNAFERLGYGKDMPEKNYAYRVFHEDEQRALAAERYKDSQNIAKDLLNKNYDDFDEADIKAVYSEMQRLEDQGDKASLRMLDRLGQKTAAVERGSGRILQAKQEFLRDTLGGALQDAHKAEEDFVIDPWRSRNKKASESNSRIAKALADMGHMADNKIKPELTHDQIKNGVIAELNKEVGSVEQYFNDNDIEFLTQLAEDKSIPVWQITSEIEHKLNTGNWYTLDESIEMPKPTNRKLQNALNSLVTETIRAESEAPSIKQIAEEVRNTLGKESADFEGLFTDDDMDYLANLIHEGATKEDITQALDMKLATGSFGISDETLQEVNNIFKQISNYDPNSKQFVEGQAEAYRLLANEILPNATPKEKFEAWRYLAMLGNPKTMLRNFIGNQTFNVVTGLSNNVAAVAEAGIDKAAKALGGEGIQRTKAVLNPVTDSGLIKAAAEDADASRYRQIIGSKYEKMSEDTLRKSKSVFNSKLAQLYEKITDAGISDYSAVKKKYSTSLAGYLKANGYNTDIFKVEDQLRNLKSAGETRLLSGAEKDTIERLSKDVQELEKARDYALKQAEYATFHEDNKIASVLSKWSKTSKEEGTGIGHVLIEGVVPFKKTPANVLKSGVEYSPLGAIDSIKKTGKLVYENTGARKGNLADVYKNSKGKDVARTLASDVIDSWAKTLTGTGLTALGYYLYNKGILHSSDPDTKYQDELEGHQNYAIEINGKSYTIDWAAPTVMPLMVGAEIAKLWDSTGKGDEDFYNNIDGYVEAANRITDPLIETSMLQGVRDTLETAASYAQNNEAMNILPLLGYNVATGYATQGIPTLGGQIARTIDPTRRSTYTDQEGVAGVLDRQVKKQMNKIPGLSMLNQPYVDTYGREQQNSPFNNPAANLGYQMFSPGYLSNINETDADRVSREAYDIGKVANTLPKWQSKFKDAEGKRVSPEDYTKASKAYGQANFEIREALANDSWFNSLDGAQKEEIVKSINTIAEHTGNAAIDPEYSKDSKAYNAYKEGGIKGLKEYWKGEANKDKASESGLSSSSNASKAIQQDLANGNEQAAQQKIDAAVELKDLGLTKPGPSYTYYTAQEVIPGLTTQEFAKTYKAIDKDGNQGIKQDEVIDYLNSKKITSESEANKIWAAYGNSTWKSIPTLENGTWKKKKK